ncbi:MAG: nucleotidyltransferase domain-containing protein [Lachnospiraceae bacterium]|nr:nucleotidyltransferase domain-containing protein [Lachnospiraceae bacterium]
MEKFVDDIWEYCELARKNEIERVILFGSRARGDYHKTSDIDLATIGGRHARFATDIDEFTDTLLKYDVVDLNGTVQEELRKAIQKEGYVLYEKI